MPTTPEELVNPLFPEVLDAPKIVIRKISGSRGLFASYDPDGLYPFSTIILALPFAALEGVPRARVPKGAAEKSKSFDPLFVLGVINSRAASFYFDVMVTDGLSVAPDQVRRIPIPRALADLQKDVAQHVSNLLRLKRELREERRLSAFRNAVSSRVRTGEDDLGQYLNKLGESGLSVGNRLDGVSKARKASVAPELRGNDLVLKVMFEEGQPPNERSGEIVCRFDRSVNRYLSLVLEDRVKPSVGNGRLMTKIRAIAVPRFDPDWETHLKIVRDIVSTVEGHEARSIELETTIATEESRIDSVVFQLYGLDKSEISVVESLHSTTPRPAKVEVLNSSDTF